MLAIDHEKQVVFGCLRSGFRADASPRILRGHLSRCLRANGFEFFEEVPLAYNAGRVDFLSRHGYALLVFQRESINEAFLRVRAVALDDRVQHVLVITTSVTHRNLPGGLCRKPIDVIWLGGLS